MGDSFNRLLIATPAQRCTAYICHLYHLSLARYYDLRAAAARAYACHPLLRAGDEQTVRDAGGAGRLSI